MSEDTNNQNTTQLPDPASNNNLRDKIQKQVVAKITQGLEDGDISEDRAREIAKMILEQIPEGISEKDLIHKVPLLDDVYHELQDIVMPVVVNYEKKIRLAVEEKVMKLIKERDFDRAVEVARQGIIYTKKFVRGEM